MLVLDVVQVNTNRQVTLPRGWRKGKDIVMYYFDCDTECLTLIGVDDGRKRNKIDNVNVEWIKTAKIDDKGRFIIPALMYRKIESPEYVEIAARSIDEDVLLIVPIDLKT